MTYAQAVKDAETFLLEHEITDASVDAWLLFSYVTQISRAMFLAERTRQMPKEQYQRYQELLEKRASHIPLQHLTGEQEFMGFPFWVNQHVLVPRQDTETLVETVLLAVSPGMRVLDLCTGSGCIAVSLAKLCPGLLVDAADISEEALAVAMENAAHLEADVTFWQGDLFACRQMRTGAWRKEKQENAYAEAETSLPPAAYDCIVSNPPYIASDEIGTLMEEVRDHEPIGALDGSADGLAFYRRLVQEGKDHLKSGGWMLFEIGCTQAEAVMELLKKGGFQEIYVKKDLAGLDRVVGGRKPKQEERKNV